MWNSYNICVLVKVCPDVIGMQCGILTIIMCVLGKVCPDVIGMECGILTIS